jgi:hypothetical protein
MATLFLVLKHTVFQFGALFGVFLAGGLVLTFLSRWTSNALGQFVYPRFGLYLFGLIGIPVHEFSHAIFCKLFLHEVKKIKWFDAKAKGGALGSVEHAFNPWNIYHRIGHFFIGLGPTIFGPVLLAALFYLLVPSGRSVFHIDLTQFTSAEHAMQAVLATLLKTLSARAALTSVGFYIFLYLAICISSQIELSQEDLKQVGTGVVPILLVLFCGNVLAWALGAAWHARVLSASQHLIVIGAGFFTFAIFLSALNLGLCTLIFGFTNRILGHEAVNPFRACQSGKTN